MNEIKLNEVYKPKKDYKVIVKTITFNQSKYIQDTLNGVAMQKTSFPFVNIILEDNSTDGEQKVIKTWLESNCDIYLAEYYDIPTANVIIIPHKTNPNCTFAVYFHKENLFRKKAKREEQVNPWRVISKYEALCEGDDYWIDPYKLQKQVDFLESNPDYSMCFHKANIINELNRNVALKSYIIENRDYTANELFCNWIIPTASMVYRKEVISYPYKKLERMMNGDIVIVLTCASLGKIRGFNDTMSTYRIQSKGVTYDEKLNKARTLKYPDHFLFIKENFPIVKSKYVNKSISEAYFGRIFVQDTLSNKIKDLLLSFCFHPSIAIKGVLRYMTDKLNYNRTNKKRMD